MFSFLCLTYFTKPNTLQVPRTKDHQDIKAEVIRTIGKKWQNRKLEKGSVCAQSCLTLWDPMDCSLPGSSVHGILQGRILEGIAISSSRGSSQHRDHTWVSCMIGKFFTAWSTKRIKHTWWLIIIKMNTHMLYSSEETDYPCLRKGE